MPTCQNCHNQWTWKQAIKSSSTLDTRMKCPHCGENQYVTPRTRKRSLIMLLIIPSVMLLNGLFGPSMWSIVVLLGLIPIYSVLYPFWLDLSSEEKLPFSD